VPRRSVLGLAREPRELPAPQSPPPSGSQHPAPSSDMEARVVSGMSLRWLHVRRTTSALAHIARCPLRSLSRLHGFPSAFPQQARCLMNLFLGLTWILTGHPASGDTATCSWLRPPRRRARRHLQSDAEEESSCQRSLGERNCEGRAATGGTQAKVTFYIN